MRLVLIGFEADFAVSIAFRLVFFVEASSFDVGFGVILLDPGNDVFGVEADFIAKVEFCWQFKVEQLHRALEQELHLCIGQLTQQATHVAIGW